MIDPLTGSSLADRSAITDSMKDAGALDDSEHIVANHQIVTVLHPGG